MLDVAMPGLDGLELQCRLVEVGQALPIVFLTGHGSIPMSVQAIKAGAADFLTEPVKAEALLGAVRAANELGMAGECRQVRHRHAVCDEGEVRRSGTGRERYVQPDAGAERRRR